ncbi:MAG TPA: TPM domain-containing protein [Casimicrobiaceae bacterium]|nr:TPM domain-containing protein [Casimicrobiaceae bacterium]
MRRGSRLDRLWRHLVTDRRHVHRTLPPGELARVEKAIAEGERRHSGQVCFAVEAALPLSRVWHGVSPRERALEVFGLLRVWDTERNDGVLVYVLLADRDVEIVADRGIHARVGDEGWRAVCRRMETAFREGRYTEGVEQGLAAVADLLATHSPRTGGQSNELSDKPVIL